MTAQAIFNRFGPLKPAMVRTARRVRHSGVRMRATVERHGLVLMYHRIAAPGPDPWDLAVSPAHFGEHLQVIKRYATCLPLSDFAARLAAPDRPRRMLAITFDDGYRDNLLAAAPALEAHDIPATMFVVSGTIGAGRDFWWDALARVFLATPSLPDLLCLTVDGVEQRWCLQSGAVCTAAEIASLSGWSVDRDAPSHPRQQVFLAVWRALADRPPAEAEGLCEAVMDWAGVDRSGPAASHSMSAADVARLAANGLIEIGGHTVTHLPLDRTDTATAAAEIADCRTRLHEITGRPITSFSYPSGRYRADTPALVREAGFARACTSRHSLCFADTDRLQIPRIAVPDLDGDQFASLLAAYAGP